VTFKGEGFKEEILNGNEESSEEGEEGSKEKETLTNHAGRRPR
jgi:hypothetical protein